MMKLLAVLAILPLFHCPQAVAADNCYVMINVEGSQNVRGIPGAWQKTKKAAIAIARAAHSSNSAADVGLCVYHSLSITYTVNMLPHQTLGSLETRINDMWAYRDGTNLHVCLNYGLTFRYFFGYIDNNANGYMFVLAVSNSQVPMETKRLIQMAESRGISVTCILVKHASIKYDNLTEYDICARTYTFDSYEELMNNMGAVAGGLCNGFRATAADRTKSVKPTTSRTTTPTPPPIVISLTNEIKTTTTMPPETTSSPARIPSTAPPTYSTSRAPVTTARQRPVKTQVATKLPDKTNKPVPVMEKLLLNNLGPISIVPRVKRPSYFAKRRCWYPLWLTFTYSNLINNPTGTYFRASRLSYVSDPGSFNGRVGLFDNSLVVAPLFNGFTFAHNMVLHARLRIDSTNRRGNGIDILFTNGACYNSATLFMGYDRGSGRVMVSLRTRLDRNEATIIEVNAPTNAWVEVRLDVTGSQNRMSLSAMPNGQAGEKATIWKRAGGGILPVNEALYIGNYRALSPPCQPFAGRMDFASLLHCG